MRRLLTCGSRSLRGVLLNLVRMVRIFFSLSCSANRCPHLLWPAARREALRFIGVCWALLMILWWLPGISDGKFLRRFPRPSNFREREGQVPYTRVIMELIPFLFPK